MNKRAVFIDRDGTIIQAILRNLIIEGKRCLRPTSPRSLKELKIFPNTPEVLKSLKEMGFLRILVTNQPDVAYGYLKSSEWQKIQNNIEKFDFDDAFICRHTRYENCYFRKPSPGMLLAAADKWGIDLEDSWMIGDSQDDIGAGKAAKCKTILLARNYNVDVRGDYTVKNFVEAGKLIERMYYKR